jgi:hypothetical protein
MNAERRRWQLENIAGKIPVANFGMRDARVRALSRAKLVVAESALIPKWPAGKQISLAPFAEKIH